MNPLFFLSRTCLNRWRIGLGLIALVIATAFGGLAGCSTAGGAAQVPAPLRWSGLRIVADADANANTAVALDIVFVRDAATLDALLALPARNWFANRTQWLLSHPGAITLRSLEIVPQQRIRLTDKDLGSPRVAGVLLFADYAAPGEYRARMPALTRSADGALVRLGARSFSVTAEPLGPTEVTPAIQTDPIPTP